MAHLIHSFSLNRQLLLLGLLAFLLLPFLACYPPLETARNSELDALIRQRAATRTADPRILVVDIDDFSLQALSEEAGKWPWPRSLHAELLEYLLAQKPKAVLFDVLFSEPDRQNPDADAYFNEVLAKHPPVYLAALVQQSSAASTTPLLSDTAASLWQAPGRVGSAQGRALLLLPKAVPSALWRVGHINLQPDSDGVSRHYDNLLKLSNWALPSLASRAVFDAGQPVLPQDRWLIDWPGPSRMPHQRIAYADLLAAARGLESGARIPELTDRWIIIGSTASGLYDLRKTPMDSFYPAVFIVSSALDNLLNANQLNRVPLWISLSWGWILLLSCTGLLLRERWPAALALAGIGVAAQILVSLYLARQGWLLLSAPNLISLAILLGAALALFYRRRRHQLRQTVAVFSRFMDPKVVNHLLAHEDANALLSSRECQLTVLFSDIRNFTTLSEQHSPQEIMQILERYFASQVDTLFAHHATLDKFIGDAIMAFWGAPLDNTHQAVDAVSAALSMLDNLEQFRREFGYPDFAIGIGIHTGPAVVGLVGTSLRYDYTAIGDTVNLASRIEGLTKGRAGLLVSAATRNACGEAFDFTQHGFHQVKGRSEPVELFEPHRKSV